MTVEFDTLTGEPLDASQTYVHTLSDESGFYGQTFVATSANLSQIEFALDTWTWGSTATFTVMIATVRFDANGMHPDAVLWESALITVSADSDDIYDIMAVSVSGLELVPGQRYVILFNSNSGDGNGGAGIRFATNPSDDDGNFVYRHTASTDPDDATVFAEDWYEDPLNGSSSWGDIAIRLTYDSVNVIDGTEGDDPALIGTAGDDQINGYGGHDYIRGAEGNDELNGGAGDDYLGGGEGDDSINGGDGFDRAAFSVGATGGVTVDLNLQGTAQDTGQGLDTLTGIEHVSGTRFSDVITGDAGDNWLWGGSDGSGVTGDDTISGGDGNDLVQVGTGNHTLDGGTGTDTLSLHGNGTDITPDGVTVSLGLQGGAQDTEQGSMTLTGFENLSGSTFADHLTGDGGDNVLAGNAGDDALVGDSGNDTLYGDGLIHADTHGVGTSGPIVTIADTGAAGNDMLEGGLGDDHLDGGAGSDTASYFNALGGVGVWLGGGYSWGAEGSDSLVNIENVIGSNHADELYGDDNANLLAGAGGNDTLVGFGGDDMLEGGDGHDYLEGNDGADQLYGGADDDYLYGNAGDDLIDGGDGYDRAGFSSGATAGVTVDLNLQGTAQDTGQGWDTLVNIEHVSGTRFSDVITGDAGDNWLWGGSDGSGVTGDDTISGGDGNDLVQVGTGNHTLDGGSGTDTLLLDGNGTDITPDGVTVSLALQGGAQDTEQGSMTLTGFENLSGSWYGDHLTGDGSDNVLAGDAGDDTLVGGEGNDTLYGDGAIDVDTHDTGRSGPIVTVADNGAAGNDTLEGGLGDDHLDGGAGSDTASYVNALGGVFVNLGSGFASGADGFDTLVSIENVTGSDHNDTLWGNGEANTFSGGGGNDFIVGQGGDDTLYGEAGDDFLRGDAGNDQMYAGDGNDYLRGSSGVDYYDGGSNSAEWTTYGWGDRISFYEFGATQGVVADLRTGIISNDGFGNVETMVGIESLGSDTAFVDTFYGNDENNLLMASLGDYLYGFGGTDDFYITSAAAIVDGGDGIDTLALGSGGGWLMVDSNGDGFAEQAAATSGGWTVNLTTGETVDGYGNIGSVAAIENVDGSENGDTITGDANGNVLNGHDGDDVLSGGGGEDTLNGGAGDDVLDGGSGGDSMAGGAGNDVYIVDQHWTETEAGDGIYENADEGIDEIHTSLDFGLWDNVENLTATGTGNTFLGGNTLDNVITGNSGNNYIIGGEGNDTLDGGDGWDTAAFVLPAGTTGTLHVVEGSGGTLLVRLVQSDGSFEDVFEVTPLGEGTATVTGLGTMAHHGIDTVTTLEDLHFYVDGGVEGQFAYMQLTPSAPPVTDNFAHVSGSVNGDTLDLAALYPDAGPDVWINANGGYGDDVILGTDGDNYMLGDSGNDTLEGRAGNDNLNGGSGNDTLIGGTGNDYVDGNEGDDTIDGGADSDIAAYRLPAGTTGTLRYVEGPGGTILVQLVQGDGSFEDVFQVTPMGQGAATITGLGMMAHLGTDTITNLEYLHVYVDNWPDPIADGQFVSLQLIVEAPPVTENFAHVSGSVNGETIDLAALYPDAGPEVWINANGGFGDDVILGTAGDNWLSGDEGNDTIDGGDGNDGLAGGSGDDSLFGSAGNDWLDAGEGNDSLDGGEGNDGLSGGEGDDQLLGGGGDDWLDGGNGSDTLSGGAGNDHLIAGEGDDSLDGGDNHDFIQFVVPPMTGTLQVVDGPDGTLLVQLVQDDGSVQDVFVVTATSTGSATVTGVGIAAGQGTDTVSNVEDLHFIVEGPDPYGSGQFTSILLAPAHWGSHVTGSVVADVIDLYDYPGAVNANGDRGDDVIYGTEDTNYIWGNSGNDTIDGRGGNDFLWGDEGDDVLHGGDGHDALRGGAGDDQHFGGAGNDFMFGALGDDLYDGGDGVDRVSLFNNFTGVTVDLNIAGPQNTGVGFDTFVGIEDITATYLDDTLTGDGASNWFWVFGGNDTLFGNGGDDLFSIGSGDKVIDGGDGSDTVEMWDDFAGYGPEGITMSLELQGGWQWTGLGSLYLTNMENLAGYWGDDHLTGDVQANVLAGGDGSDTLVGGGGNDTLLGDGVFLVGGGAIVTDPNWGSGNDMLEGGLGDDHLDGGAGIDTASYAGAAGGVEVLLYAGSAYGADGNDTLVNIENVIGSDHGDWLMGDWNANSIAGLGGNDSVSGFGGDDTVDGGDGHDVVRGDGGNDTVLGGTGDDYVIGGIGDDLVDGQDGYDRTGYYHVDSALGGVTVSLLLQGQWQDTGIAGSDFLVSIEAVSGTPFADTITGDDNGNWLWGSSSFYDAGSGVIQSTSNDDTISAGGGDDLVQVGGGNHTLDGGTGADWLFYNENGAPEVGVTISLALQGTAQDTGAGLWTISGFENLDGSYGDDQLTGDEGDNILAGNGGNDLLVGGGGNDRLLGDGGADQLTDGHAGPVTTVDDLGYAVGDDTLEGGLGDDHLDGGAGIDTASYINAAGGVEVHLWAGAAYGADGTDTLVNVENLIGSDYNDLLVGDWNGNSIEGGAGNDNIWGEGGDDNLSGGDGHDYVRGGDGNDTVSGGSGDDFLYGNFGDDLIDGGDGFDRAGFSAGATGGVTVDLNLQGTAQDTGQGWDTLVGIEHVSGTVFDDVIIGDAGDNWLWSGWDGSGGSGNDTISAGDGNDLVSIGTGNHNVDGGAGIDTLSFYGLSVATASAGVTFSLALQGTSQDSEQGLTVATGFENLVGSSYADHLTGDSGDNVLAGHGGNDTLAGGEGNDTLYGDGTIQEDTHGTGLSGPIGTVSDIGAAGNDTLEGGLGDDLIDGGAGSDTASYVNALGGMFVNLGSGFASGADGFDTLVSIENVTGSDHDDTLFGSGEANTLSGGGGNDFIAGLGGDDTLHGEAGDDFLRGDAGDDQMYAGDGNDYLRGSSGVDYYDGGSNSAEWSIYGWGDRISFYEVGATQGVVADLRTGIISNDGFGNVETMVGIESLGSDTAFVDTFYGNDENNLLMANLGDYLYGFGGNDDFYITSAAAMVDGGDGTDTLALGSGGGWLMVDSNGDGFAEQAAATSGGWTVNLTTGETVDGYGNIGSVAAIENVDGSENGDTITGDANGNVLNGHDGDDVLSGGGGDDTIDGGAGIDTASYVNALGGVEVHLWAGAAYGADGNDTLVNVENVVGSDYDDLLVGDWNANSLDGGAGNDNIWGEGGDDNVSGGDGHDYVRGGDGNDTVGGGSGDDFLYGNAGDDLIDGGDGYDRAGFSVGATGGVTVDLNLQGTAQDTGQGWDTLVNIEHVSGTRYSDVITGDAGDNWLWGGSDSSGVTGDDTISGGGGNDLVSVGAGNHTLDGGAGTDTLSLDGNSFDISSAGVTFSLALQGTSQDSEQGMMTATGFENLVGSIYADNLTGDAGANILGGVDGDDTLVGGDGNDTLYGDGTIDADTHGTGLSGPIVTIADTGAAGNDTLDGGKGDDTLVGGAGNDVMSGGQGRDTFVIGEASGDDVITDFGGGQDTILFGADSGVTDFSQLTFTKSGANLIVEWGTTDSIVLQGVKLKDITSSSFAFEGASLSAMSFDSPDKGLLTDLGYSPGEYLI